MHFELKDRVTRLVYITLELVDQIQAAPQEIDYEDSRRTLEKLLSAVDEGHSNDEKCQLAKYALTAWIDDLLCRSNWPHALAWKAAPLERDLFGSTSRHWRFFEQAETALRLGHQDALLVFQLCVDFGFQGIYGTDRLKVQLTDRLPMTRAKISAEAPSRILAEVAASGAYSAAIDSREENMLHPPANVRTGRVDVRREERSLPNLPPTLAEWRRNTFGGLRTTSIETFGKQSNSRLALLPGRFWTEWAIVMAIGVLLSAVLLAIGH